MGVIYVVGALKDDMMIIFNMISNLVIGVCQTDILGGQEEQYLFVQIGYVLSILSSFLGRTVSR